MYLNSCSSADAVFVRCVGVQVLRMNRMDPKEEMISRMRARIQLLEQESGTHNLVLLDTDMLVVRSLAHVFEDNFDVALTWRHEINMPINGGIVFVSRNRIMKARKFLQCVDLPRLLC